MATLVLVRHAKSDYPYGVPDHDRPLSERGRLDAPAAGDWIRAHVGVIDMALVSSATRTRETWDLMSVSATEMIVDDGLYHASARAIETLIASQGGSASTLLVVGHNPGLQDLALSLAGTQESAAATRMREKYPTSAIAVFDVAAAWVEGIGSAATLVEFAVPRG